MLVKHLMLGIIFGISCSFISWIVGMLLNAILMKTAWYNNLSHIQFIKRKAVNKKIGLWYFKWIVKNTFFKFFNQKIKAENQNIDLALLRHEMTLAEISHLIAFVFVSIVAIIKGISINVVFGLTLMGPNILMNLHPSLLQQENKRRIDKLIQREKLKTR